MIIKNCVEGERQLAACAHRPREERIDPKDCITLSRRLCLGPNWHRIIVNRILDQKEAEYYT